MTFIESVQTCFSNYANFKGRATRSEYWWFALFVVLGNLVLGMVSDMLGLLFCLAILVPSIAVAARRLHDTDRSGWMQLITLIPFVGWLVVIYFLVQPGTEGSNRYGATALAAPGQVTLG